MQKPSVDSVNIMLMLGAAFVSFFIPFELFLFSYAVLGPLHYLTEISWLHRKKYFLLATPKYVWPIISVGVLFLLTIIGRHGTLLYLYASILFFIFFGALVLTVTTHSLRRLAGLALVLALAISLWISPALVAIVAVLLPTVLHVFLFTFCFMLFGALKNKSRLGVVAALLFVVLSIVLLFGFGYPEMSVLTAYARGAYASFETTNITLLSLLPVAIVDMRTAVYSSVFGIAVMRFLSFVYTYHYLNWFSKTQIIRWHLVSRKELLVICCVWLISVGVYSYDYRIGLLTLYFLSMLHVLLEFPLNQSTFTGLARMIWQGATSGNRVLEK